MTDSNAMIPAPQNTPVPAMNFGSTALDATDFIPPRVKILQPMSAETNDGGGSPGDWYNTLTGDNYGPSMTIVPITPLKQRVFLVRAGAKRDVADERLEAAGLTPLGDREGLACRSLDMLIGLGQPGDELAQRRDGHGDPQGCPQCPLSKWVGQEPPPCTETYNVVGVTLDTGDLVIVSMAKSGAKAGKRLFSMLMLGRAGARPWARAYELSTTQQRNKLGTFWTPNVKAAPEPPPTDVMREAERWYPQFTGRIIDVTQAAASEDAEDPGGPDDTEALATEAKF